MTAAGVSREVDFVAQQPAAEVNGSQALGSRESKGRGGVDASLLGEHPDTVPILRQRLG